VSGQRRILLLASGASSYGADRMLLMSVRALLGAGHDVLVAFPGTGPLVAQVSQAGAGTVVLPDFGLRRHDLHPIKLPSLARRQFQALRWLRREHRRAPFHLVYSNTQTVAVGPVLRRLLAVPHLWHVHEILVRPRWMARLLAWAARHGADRVVCVSRSVEHHLIDLDPGLSSRTQVILNGIELTDMAAVDPPSPAVPLRLGCVARLHHWKGQDVLIQAVALARREVPVKLTLFGDVYPGNEHVRRRLEQLVARLGVQEVVRFAGFEADWTRIYPTIDVCVVPSTDPEPFSLATVEAQACARPVIASRLGGPAEIVVDGASGLLVEPRSPQQLAEAIVQLARTPQLIGELGVTGRARALREFSRSRFDREIQDAAAALLPVLPTDHALTQSVDSKSLVQAERR
jgi:glycosyltransferase involved in cell wall biosynthesis